MTSVNLRTNTVSIKGPDASPCIDNREGCPLFFIL